MAKTRAAKKIKKATLEEMDRRTKEFEAGTAKVFTLDEMERNAVKARRVKKK